MNGPEFDEKSTTFWGALAAGFWFGSAFLKYLVHKTKQKSIPNNGDEEKEEKMSEEKMGIKETQEMLAGLNMVSLFVIGRVKDGIDMSDAAAVVEKLVMDQEFKSILASAIEGVNKIPAELKDIDLSEALQLGQYEVEQVKKIIEALKK